MPPAHTADRVFADLPIAAGYANRLAAVLSTAYLVAHLEALCMRELHAHVDGAREIVLGVALYLQHCGAAWPGDRVEASGVVGSIGDRESTFSVEAWVGRHLVAQGTICFAVIERERCRPYTALPVPHEPADIRCFQLE